MWKCKRCKKWTKFKLRHHNFCSLRCKELWLLSHCVNCGKIINPSETVHITRVRQKSIRSQGNKAKSRFTFDEILKILCQNCCSKYKIEPNRQNQNVVYSRGLRNILIGKKLTVLQQFCVDNFKLHGA